MKEFRSFLLSNKITPKWVIFLLDLLICLACFVYANLLLTDFKVVYFEYEGLFPALLTVGLSASLFFYIFRTYEGIIRLSESNEAIRAISAVFCSFVLMLMFNILSSFNQPLHFIPNSVLFIYFFTAAFVISGYRVLVKTLYNVETSQTDVVNVVVYGVEVKGNALQLRIAQMSGINYKVVAFVEDDEMLVGKSIDNVRIYSYKQLRFILKPLRVKVLFFSRHCIDMTLKNEVVDDCLAQHVKVMNMPVNENTIREENKINHLSEVKIEELLGRPAIELFNPAVVNFLSNKNILITGAAGSIGSELSRQVAAMNPASLIICDKAESALHNLEYELLRTYNLGDKLQSFLGDVKDINVMENLFINCKPSIVFHAAAYKHVPVMEKHPSEAIKNNVLGTKVLADLSEKYNVDRFLFISTDKAINPTNIMGASKRIAEMYCDSVNEVAGEKILADDPIVYRMPSAEHTTKFITTRFGNVLASNGSVIPRFREQIASGGPVTVTHPEIIRYFMTIQEACSLVLEAVTMGKDGQVLLFDMGKPVKILDLAKKMIMLAGYEPGKDIAITFTGLRPGEKLFEELLNKEEEVIPTHHKKILIAKKPECNHKSVYNDILKLIEMATDHHDENVVKQMKKILPEFISNNSVYELFDKTIPLERAVAVHSS